MSMRITSISLPGAGHDGTAMAGEQTHTAMVAAYRDAARRMAEQARLILEAPEEEFVVESYQGPYSRFRATRIYPTTETP